MPLRFGGLGVRWCVDVVLPSYIASFKGLVCTINHCPPGDRLARLHSALETFTNNQCLDFTTELGLKQRTLDEAASKHRHYDLISHANQVARARLLAAADHHQWGMAFGHPCEEPRSLSTRRSSLR